MLSCRPDNSVILCPVFHHFEPETDRSLRELERRGWTIDRRYGLSDISAARGRMASDALRRGYEWLFWIDADMRFEPGQFRQFAEDTGQPFECVPYMQKLMHGTIAVLPAETPVGPKSRGRFRVRAAGFGFMKTHKSVYPTDGPACQNSPHGAVWWPFFQPDVFEIDGRRIGYGEDYSFCLRAEARGFQLIANFDINIQHIGRYAFDWRVDSYDEQDPPVKFGTVKLGPKQP